MPVTRSQAKPASASADGASAQPSDTKVEPSDPVREPSLSIFADLADDSLLHGRDAKAICDATTTAIRAGIATIPASGSVSLPIFEPQPTCLRQHSPCAQLQCTGLPVDPLSDVATLSASLRDSQDQLQRSQARVSALLRRNEELTQASLERPVSPPRPTSSVLPDIRALFCVVLCLTVFASPGNAFDDGCVLPTTLLPFSFYRILRIVLKCYLTSPPRSIRLSYMSIVRTRSYTPHRHSSVRSFAILLRFPLTFSALAVKRIRKPPPLSRPEECRKLALHHRCSHGEMLEFSGLWRTSHTSTLTFHKLLSHVVSTMFGIPMRHPNPPRGICPPAHTLITHVHFRTGPYSSGTPNQRRRMFIHSACAHVGSLNGNHLDETSLPSLGMSARLEWWIAPSKSRLPIRAMQSGFPTVSLAVLLPTSGSSQLTSCLHSC
ncbi:hypothetical protein COOONC_03019 [Cooperia oncophora]